MSTICLVDDIVKFNIQLQQIVPCFSVFIWCIWSSIWSLPCIPSAETWINLYDQQLKRFNRQNDCELLFSCNFYCHVYVIYRLVFVFFVAILCLYLIMCVPMARSEHSFRHQNNQNSSDNTRRKKRQNQKERREVCVWLEAIGRVRSQTQSKAHGMGKMWRGKYAVFIFVFFLFAVKVVKPLTVEQLINIKWP